MTFKGKEKHLTVCPLGINAAFRDSSACLVNDGSLLHSRRAITQIKHRRRPLQITEVDKDVNTLPIPLCLGAYSCKVNGKRFYNLWNTSKGLFDLPLVHYNNATSYFSHIINIEYRNSIFNRSA